MKTKFILFIMPLIFLACSGTSDASRIESAQYNNPKERVEILKNEIVSVSEFYDAEFDLFNVNGFSHNTSRGIPGASSWDYKFAIKVSPFDLDTWVIEMKKDTLQNHDTGWTKEIIKQRKENWKTSGEPEFYKHPERDVMVLLFRNEGIIFKRVLNK